MFEASHTHYVPESRDYMAQRIYDSHGRPRPPGTKHQVPFLPDPSFLFVINEIKATQTAVDGWGNKCPPQDPSGFSAEKPSIVMRWWDGVVSPTEPGLARWTRDEDGRGNLLWADENNINWEPLIEYRQATFLTCHPLMPMAMVDVDATVQPTALRGSDSSYLNGGENHHVWQPLQFLQQTNGDSSVSRAVFQSDLRVELEGGNAVKYVNSKGKLMNSLIPQTYHYPYDHPSSPQALGGNITAILALLAMHAAPSPTDSPINNVGQNLIRNWQRHKWADESPPRGYAKSDLDLPYGFVIYVYYDPFNVTGSTEDALWHLEFRQTLVRE